MLSVKLIQADSTSVPFAAAMISRFTVDTLEPVCRAQTARPDMPLTALYFRSADPGLTNLLFIHSPPQFSGQTSPLCKPKDSAPWAVADLSHHRDP
jgi:hypothetical protein